MSLQLLHYRAWQGTFGRPLWSVWPIARVALATLFRRRLFWVLYAAGLLLFLMFFFGAYLLDWVETMLPATPIKIGKLSTEPERIVPILRQGLRILNGSQETFMYFFIYQSSMVMVVLTLAGSVLVGDDFTHRSLGFFLSKPIKRWHYLAAKCLAAGAVINLLTTLPALVLFAQHGLDDWEYFTNPSFFIRAGTGKGPAGWPLLLGILGYGCALTVFLSLLLVTAASWLRRTMPLIMVWTSLFLFVRLLAGMLVDLKYGDRWRLIDMWNNLCVVGSWCLGFENYTMGPAGQPTFLEASLVLLGVCILCLIYLNLRTRAVEIVR
ncbi:MAG TPA: ABC transporter permease subunit [Gemmataceae bacterium]|nr:ABC transporter permease subunit [Gemmataceae bacterium]